MDSSSRMKAAEIRTWVTPYVMRYLIQCKNKGILHVTDDELLHAGIHSESIRALVQTRRLVPETADGKSCSYLITIGEI